MGVQICPERNELLTDFGKRTLSKKYILEGEDYQDAFKRVAEAYGSNEGHAQRIYDYMSRMWFMPATPVLANGGTDRGLPISCFLQDVDDNLAAILGTFQEMGWLSSGGGGIGINWSKVREIGSKVGIRGTAEGIGPWAVIQNAYTRGLNQGDVRTASSALYLDVDHPEIESFIEIREPGGDLQLKALDCHHGVNITDRFMEAMMSDSNYDLISRATGLPTKTVSARAIWGKILEMRIKTGEPYLLFVDAVNRKKSDVYKNLGLEVVQSNLCTEITLATGQDHLGVDRTAVCCLSSVNVEYYLDWKDNPLFIQDVLEFLDNVIESFIQKASGRPGFEKAVYSASRERAVGLGVMGFHSFLMSQGVPFESAMAKSWNKNIFKHIRTHGDIANVALAVERGPCPDAADSGLVKRFSHYSSIAPTASISIICGGPTPGIEPIPAMEYIQKTDAGTNVARCKQFEHWLEEEYARRSEELADRFWDSSAYAADAWNWVHTHSGSIQGWPWASAEDLLVFKGAYELDQRWVVELAADRDDDLEQTQSVNLFFPGDSKRKDIHAAHVKAWESGMRSLYYLRSTAVSEAKTDGTSSVDYAGAKAQADECLACQ